ncbi:MAG: hypothetical protein AAFW00_24405 [Bacteroidota bacterium]
MRFLLFTLLVTVVTFSFAQPNLDPNFGESGIQQLDLGTFDKPICIRALPDGHFLILVQASEIVGFVDQDLAILKIDAQGNLDTSFGDQGKVKTDFIEFDVSHPVDLHLLDDGKFWVLGYGQKIGTDEQPYIIQRYLADGQLDTGFGDQGQQTFQFIGAPEIASRMALYPDGKYIVTGQTFDTIGIHRELPVLGRFDQTGKPDSTLGRTGKVALDFAQGVIFNIGAPRAPVRHINGGYFRDIHLEADGSILAAGAVYYNDFSYFRCGLVKFLPDGRIDSSFYSNGVLAFEPPAFSVGDRFVEHMEVLPDGRVVMSIRIEATPQNFALAILDPDLNELIYPSLDFEGNFDYIEDFTALPDGKIFLIGRSILPSNFTAGYFSDQTALARLNANLLPDNTFGINGKMLVDVGTNLKDGAYTLALAPNGDILVGGSIEVPNQSFGDDLFLMRIKGDLGTSVEKDPTSDIQFKEGISQLQINWPASLQVERISVRNLLGQTISAMPVPLGDPTVEIQSEAFTPGLYVVQVYTRGKVVSYKWKISS